MMSYPTRGEIKSICLQHLLQRLAEIETDCDPYPHFWADRILPEDVFDRLLHEKPNSRLYDHDGPESKYGNRARLELVSAALDQLPVPTAELWYGVRECLAAPEVKEAVFRKLAAGFAHRFGIPEDEVDAIQAYARPALYQEREGYLIAPHPDTRKKLATIQFALTDDLTQIDLGTSIYQLSPHPKHLMQTPRGFCEVKRYPFVRNSVFAFSVVNTMAMKSWHGREKLPAGCGVRDTLLHIYYANATDANSELVAIQSKSAAAA